MSAITPLTYQIFLALADGPLHGYGIVKEIEERAGSDVAPSTGALYLALQRMESAGFIRESADRPAEEDDARRRYYVLTPAGRERAEDESARLSALVGSARSKGLLAGGTP